MGRIDQIFIYTIDDEQRLFIMVMPIKILEDTDAILGLHEVRYLQREPIIIGINSLSPIRLYIVAVNDNTTVLVDWQVDWL
jgi:hypothetical protein